MLGLVVDPLAALAWPLAVYPLPALLVLLAAPAEISTVVEPSE